MRCPKCDKENSDAAAFCNYCGHRLSTAIVKEEIGHSSQTIIGIKKMNVCHLIILTLFTTGVYIPIWFLTRRDAINRIDPKWKIGTTVFIIAVVVFSLDLLFALLMGDLSIDFLSSFLTNSPVPNFSSNPLGAVAAFLYALMIPVTGLTNLALLVYCFDVLYVIEKRFNIRSTWFSTSAAFFFGLFYVQYRINRLTIQG